jgi:alpha-mannosidase
VASVSGAKIVDVVPHTHWDREWYLPFQTFRIRLVDLIDRLLDEMEADERLRFTLDGQLAVVDDYLEIRPEAEPRLHRLVTEGRLAIGPWQVLMDEFLVSGETIVRNLEAGLQRGEELGGAMAVGYLPDQFGHIAQMPQILRRAGLERAVVWRGVPAAVDRHAFVWEAPDGTAVQAEYLVGGYGNAAHLFARRERAVERLESLAQRLSPFFGDDNLLAMVGTDHMEPEPELVERVEALNAEQDRFRLRIATLAGHLGQMDGETGLDRLQGELRSGARANMLMGVTSARCDLKAACARAERLLERYAEPFQALYGSVWPDRYLRLAWGRVIENSAHDSICGCSVDAVCEQVLARYAEAEQIAAELAARAAQTVALGVPHGSFAVLNPSPYARSGLVEVELPISESWDDVALALDDGTLVATQEADRRQQLLKEPRRTLLASIPAPALGWRALRPVRSTGQINEPVEVGGRWLRNNLLEVEVAANGTLNLSGGGVALEGAGRLVDGGDAGDSYNYAPPAGDVLVEEPEDIAVDVLATGPVRGELAVTRAYRWPRGLLADASGRTRETALVAVTTRIELRAGEPFLRLRVSFENSCDDHRLRLHVPLHSAAAASFAEGQFAVVERGLDAEGGHGELPLPTFPARGFVDAGGVAVLLDHVLEYELIKGRELALTLLRATGLISRSSHRYREEPAGPQISIPAAQCHGPWSVTFGIFPHAGAWHQARVLEQQERYQHDFLAVPGSGPGQPAGEGLELVGEGVVLSSLRRRGDWLELRLVCQHPEPRSTLVRGGFREAREADLLGRPGRTLELELGELRLELGGWEIRTVQLRR